MILLNSARQMTGTYEEVRMTNDGELQYGKIRPQVLANHSVRDIFTNSSHIIKQSKPIKTMLSKLLPPAF